MMRESNIDYIKEVYGRESLLKVEEYIKDKSVNVVLIYAECGEFEVLGGMLTNHSMSIDNALDLLDIDMDDYAKEKYWDGWNYEALDLINVN